MTLSAQILTLLLSDSLILRQKLKLMKIRTEAVFPYERSKLIYF
jgi:hypothetical protein